MKTELVKYDITPNESTGYFEAIIDGKSYMQLVNIDLNKIFIPGEIFELRYNFEELNEFQKILIQKYSKNSLAETIDGYDEAHFIEYPYQALVRDFFANDSAEETAKYRAKGGISKNYDDKSLKIVIGEETAELDSSCTDDEVREVFKKFNVPEKYQLITNEDFIAFRNTNKDSYTGYLDVYADDVDEESID